MKHFLVIRKRYFKSLRGLVFVCLASWLVNWLFFSKGKVFIAMKLLSRALLQSVFVLFVFKEYVCSLPLRVDLVSVWFCRHVNLPSSHVSWVKSRALRSIIPCVELINLFPSRLVFGMLYPAYYSYKAVKTKNVKEYVSKISVILILHVNSTQTAGDCCCLGEWDWGFV